MRSIYRRNLERMYRNAKCREDLPWHSTEPPPMLTYVLENRGAPGSALDLGCGTGEHSILMARMGYEVTGVDYVAEAVRLARENARKANVGVEFLEADVLTWRAPRRYDLVLDAGCLHGIPGDGRRIFRRRLLQWLATDGDYVLVHFSKKHLLDYCPVGPRRIPRARLVRWFAPEFEEHAYRVGRRPMPFPIGPVVSVGSYWFRRSGAD